MSERSSKGMAFIIGASSVGTLIEWYDFYIFGMLATTISKQFFPGDAGTSALLGTLAIFAAGFIVRPFGALVFGRLGDRVGRKYTFLLTLILMGGSTFCIGLVPGFKSIGWAAPILVLVLRLIQGLALGGEYGGAATYVAEHAPAERRGFWTSWIQTTATLGLFLALGVIILIRQGQGVERFTAEWGGWRYPFWISLLLVLVSVMIRMKMQESPLFVKVKAEGNTSVNPLKESFGHRANFKMVLLALFGAVMGQGVVWYTGQFYAQSFIENICHVSFIQSRNIILVSILFATPFFIVFGSWSDRIGRKWIMLIGMLLGVLFYRPIYSEFLRLTGGNEAHNTIYPPLQGVSSSVANIVNQDKRKLLLHSKVNVTTDDGILVNYSFTDTLKLVDPFVTNTSNIGFVKKGQKADQAFAKASFANAEVNGVSFVVVESMSASPARSIEKTLPQKLLWKMVLLVFIQILFVTMVYGPIAAFLVELFPTRIRYTSMSLPYHIGNGVFGGLVPFLGTLIVELSKSSANPNGDPLAGLWYPIGVAGLCFIVGLVYLPNKSNKKSLA